MPDHSDDIKRLRREPPPFRRVVVGTITDLTPHLRRFTLGGSELKGLEITEPAASVRLLLPSPGADDLVMPEWTGNEFLLPDGRQPLIRTFTPRHLRTDPAELDIDVVLHGDIGASGWARSAGIGAEVAVSGPGRGYTIDPSAAPLHLFGDETAIPAIAQLLEWAPEALPIVVHIEARREARLQLPDRGPVEWHDLDEDAEPGSSLIPAVAHTDLGPGARVWAAGEAAAMQQIRRHLADRGVDRSRTTVRGYWKRGRAGPGI